MRLILTRHGETLENQKGVIQGHLHGTLSENGVNQAKKLAERLKNEKIDVIYSSDLERAACTAREIARFHPGVELIFVRDLREKHCGVFQGKTKRELGWTDKSVTCFDVPEGESLECLFERAKSFLMKVFSEHENDTVLFVTHSGMGRALIAVLLNKSFEAINDIHGLKNTCVNVFDVDEENNTLHVFNCVKHLE